jgi:hypothetical protein
MVAGWSASACAGAGHHRRQQALRQVGADLAAFSSVRWLQARALPSAPL